MAAVETPVYFNDGASPGFIVHFSGYATSTVRSSTEMIGVGIGNSSSGFDVDKNNFVIADWSNDKLWYMSGQYTTTVKNSISQTVSTYLSLSLGLIHTYAIGSGFPGSSEMILYSGKVTSTIKATFDGANQSIYPGNNSPRCGFIVGPTGNERPVFWVEPSIAEGGSRYIRLSGFFTSVIEDVEDGTPINIPGQVDVVYMAYDGDLILWAGQATTAQVHKSTYFGSRQIPLADISRPLFVGASGWDGLSNDVWDDRFTINFPESLSHTLTLTASAQASQTHTPVFKFPSFLTFGHSVLGGVFAATSDLVFTTELNHNDSVFNRAISHNIDLNGLGSVTTELSPSAPSTITFTHSVQVPLLFVVEHTIDFGQTIASEAQNSVVEQTLTFTQTVSTTGTTRLVSVEHTIDFNPVHAAWLTSVSDCIYDPQPPRTIEFPVVPQSFIRLQDDLQTPVNTIDIRSANLGNIEEIELFRVFNTSRSRTYTAFRDPAWPQNRSIKIVSSENTQAESITFLAFLVATAGIKIRLIDWEGRHWLGVITNPSTAVQDLGTCRFQFNIDFVGELTEPNIAGQTYNRSLEHNFAFGFVIYREVVGEDVIEGFPPDEGI